MSVDREDYAENGCGGTGEYWRCHEMSEDYARLVKEVAALEAERDRLRETVRGHEAMRWPEEAHRLQQQRNALAEVIEQVRKALDQAMAEFPVYTREDRDSWGGDDYLKPHRAYEREGAAEVEWAIRAVLDTAAPTPPAEAEEPERLAGRLVTVRHSETCALWTAQAAGRDCVCHVHNVRASTHPDHEVDGVQPGTPTPPTTDAEEAAGA